MPKQNKKKSSSTAGQALALGTALSLGAFGFTAIGTGAAFADPTSNTATALLNTTKIIKLANGKTRIRVDLADNLRGKTVTIRTSRIVNGERRVVTLGRIKLTKTGKGVLTVTRQIRVDDRIIVRDGTTKIVNSKISVIDDRTPAVPAPTPTPPPASGGGSSSTPAAVFTMTEGATGVWTLSTGNGNVVVTAPGDDYVFTPASGTAITKAKAGVTTVVVNTITFSGTATVLKQLTAITGAVTVTDSAISVADANSLNAITSAVVTATLAGETLANLGALTETGNAYTITVSAVTGTPMTAADLSNLRNKTIGVVTVSIVAPGISGTVAEVIQALLTDSTKIVTGNDVGITLTDVGSVADTNAIAAANSGPVKTGRLTTGTYGSLAAGDKIATGLTFESGASSAFGGQLPAPTAGQLDFAYNTDTGILQFETADNGTTPVVVSITLTGIGSVTEAAGVFTLVAP